MGLLDKNGKEVTEIKYDRVSYFNEGLSKVSLNGKSGFINNKGHEVIPLKYENSEFDMSIVTGSNTDFFSEGLAKVKLNGKWGFIDKSGVAVIPIIYDKIEAFRDGLSRVTKDGKKGYINKAGLIIIPFDKYDHIGQFSFEGITEVKINNKYGLIDKNGKELTPIKYDWINGFCEGLANVTLGSLNGFIDQSGKELIPIKYEEVHYCYDDGLTAAKLNGKWGFIDKSDNEVISLKYDEVIFDNGSGLFYGYGDDIKVKVKIGDRDFYIDRSGNEVNE